MRRAQAVQGQHGQRGRAVDEDEVIVLGDGGEGDFEARFTLFQFHHFHFGTGQFAVGGQHVEATGLRALAHGADVGHAQQHFIDRAFQRRLVDPRPHGGIALRIEVGQQYALVQLCQSSREIDCGSGLAYATFLVGDTKYFCHSSFL